MKPQVMLRGKWRRNLVRYEEQYEIGKGPYSRTPVAASPIASNVALETGTLKSAL